jgi:hypothetical protein
MRTVTEPWPTDQSHAFAPSSDDATNRAARYMQMQCRDVAYVGVCWTRLWPWTDVKAPQAHWGTGSGCMVAPENMSSI